MKKLITVICYFVLLFLVGHFGLHAQVYVSLNATGAGDGSSWADAYTSIPDAVSGSPKGSALWIAAGTYTLSQPLVLEEADLDLIGGFAGTESALDQRDFSQETILSADAAGDDLPGDLVSNSSDNLEHVLLISESTPMTIDGIVIEGGRGALSGTFADLAATGGGVFCVGEIDFINCKIRNNVARFGAGLYLINTGAIPGVYSFTNCEITGNEGNSFGGGIYAAFGGTTVSFKDCTFSKNKAA
ncbi:MAG: right-handed parallel beta-helix repeat-containing protein, partial [Saprospiraceae bacterium]|nr:right-handed parallel beta-helix repeat-containing protein [Saprospiraceae bacterium]